ncbi:MAG: helix-turn-helix domain-containing protein [Lachnospiraceae bacterium]|nr:helix-turn-helix domain-containing protein [Lachnospiraceae bacterium]
MDQIKIGRFIANERKEHGYTQRQLAELLDISDKTISKWETGNGFPEISLLLPLCNELDINVNELLSGGRLSEADYKQKAEENMVNMMKEKEANRKNYRLINIVEGMSAVVFGVLMIVISVYGSTIPTLLTIVLTVLAISEFTVGLYVATQGERTIGYYRCPKCDGYFIPTYREYMKGMHFWSTRKLQCPHCNQKVWAKKVMSKDE